MTPTPLEEFEWQFGPNLAGTLRWRAFRSIAEWLLSLERPVHILETGCARNEGNWGGDGCSTLVWNWIVGRTGGQGVSVDLSQDNVDVAARLCPHMHIHCADSIAFLSKWGAAYSPDLLYLDSYDYKEPHALSELHHAGELAAIYERLPSGCLIAVDDCHSPTSGKHVLVKAFFERLGVAPWLESYITVWIKP